MFICGFPGYGIVDSATARTQADQTTIQRQIDAADRQIDHLVYELYGLTVEEIKIVEDATVG